MKNYNSKLFVLLVTATVVVFAIVKIANYKRYKIVVTSIEYRTTRPEISKWTMTIEDYATKQMLNDEPILSELEPILKDYPDLEESLITSNIKLPTNDTMVYQGITTIKDKYIIVTAYDATGKEDSKCYVLNEVGRVLNVASIKTHSHVGGISYDANNELIWLPEDDGILNAYNIDDILTDSEVEPTHTFTNISENFVDYQSENKKAIDFLTVDDNALYIGNFSLNRPSSVRKYTIAKEEDNIELTFSNKFELSPKTQGIAFYEKDDEKYLITSNSYGRHKDSQLEIYSVQEDEYSKNEEKTMTLPPLLEQISTKKDKLYLLFESGAKKYSDGPTKIHTICELDLNTLLDDD